MKRIEFFKTLALSLALGTIFKQTQAENHEMPQGCITQCDLEINHLMVYLNPLLLPELQELLDRFSMQCNKKPIAVFMNDYTFLHLQEQLEKSYKMITVKGAASMISTQYISVVRGMKIFIDPSMDNMVLDFCFNLEMTKERNKQIHFKKSIDDFLNDT